MKHIVTIRPAKGSAATVALAAQMGLSVEAFPQFEIVARGWDAPDPASVDALLIGSVNAFHFGGANLTRFTDKPVYAVGQTTAAAARAAHFEVAEIGQGGLQDVLNNLSPGDHRLLRLTAEKHVPLEPRAGITIIRRIVYASQALPMTPGLSDALAQGALVLLHSGEAANHFMLECERLGHDKSRIAIAALGPRILDCAGDGWAAANAAPQPRDEALLALAREMWQG